MKLTVLGGSAAGVGTRQGCSSYLIESEQSATVLDLGPNTLAQLRAHTDFRTLDGVVISHLHVDHILDLVALRFALAHNPVPPPKRVPLHLPPDGMAMLTRLARAFETPDTGLEWFSEVFDVSEYDPGSSVECGNFAFTFAPTVHYVPCWAIRVHPTDDSGDLLYTADTGPASDLSQIGRDVHVLLAEGTATEDSDEPFATRGHITPAEAGELATRLGVTSLILTHIWEENDPSDAIGQAATTFPGAVMRATPGLELTWRR